MTAPVFQRIPLQGQLMIEASAGTGKTYALCMIYLRLIVERGLSVQQILVLTFTNAATEELRARMRSLLANALQFLREGGCADIALNQQFASMLSCSNAEPLSIQRVQDAIYCMDESAIYTIHGFCQRTLNTHSFLTGSAFEIELMLDESVLLEEVVQDFWRLRVLSLSGTAFSLIRSVWKTPVALLKTLGPALRREDASLLPQVDEAELQDGNAKWESISTELQAAFQSLDQLDLEYLRTSKDLKRNGSLRNVPLEKALESVRTWLQLGAVLPLPKTLERFGWAYVQSQVAKDKEVKCRALFSICQSALDLGRVQYAHSLAGFIYQAIEYVRTELPQRKLAAGVMFHNDLLNGLHSALGGPGGDDLAETLAQKFPAVLVDEFQDTDPTQYEIFRRAFASSGGMLCLIGDAKQSIYGFRGGDVFTYMRARKAITADAGLYQLQDNYRSTTDLVDGVNALFENGRNPFLYGEEMPYVAVRAQGGADQQPFTIDGCRQTPLAAWFLAQRESKKMNQIQALVASQEAVCQEISRLLDLALQGKAMIGERALKAADIVVLVRDHKEAAWCQDGLRSLGIDCAMVSRQSVFESEEAFELLLLLRVLESPYDATRLKTAMCTRLFGYDATTMLQKSADDVHWEGLVRRLINYREIWLSDGIEALLLAFIGTEGLCNRLLGAAQGNRRMTNFLHLVELVDQACPGLEIAQQSAWLQAQMGAETPQLESHELRLESDANLVKIVTIHKSKGMEYPLVFLFSPWKARAKRKVSSAQLIAYHDQQGSSVFDIGSVDRSSARSASGHEESAEDLRLLYVALTRARHRCYFTWAAAENVEHSAMAYLLHFSPASTREKGDWKTMLDEDIVADLREFAGDESLLELLEPEKKPHTGRAEPPGKQPEELSAKRFTGQIRQQWRVSSYSQLFSESSRYDERPDHDAEPMAIDVTPVESAMSTSVQFDRFAFPRGSKAGQCLHLILEKLDFSAPASDANRAIIEEFLDRFGYASAWLDPVTQWMASVLETTIIPSANFALAKLASGKRLDELGFHFPVKRLRAADLNQLMAAYDLFGGKLAFRTLQGVMKGFIDLVFEVDGKFYLADYKSNYLGPALGDYTPDNLERAMTTHRYDLQYLIYSLALHRYLRFRISDYRYETHFGGVFYLFLRGMSSQTNDNSGVYYRLPAQGFIESLDQLLVQPA